MKKKSPITICTKAPGGMRSVIEGYESDGLFERWNMLLINSHAQGPISLRLKTAFVAFTSLIGLLLRRRVSFIHCHAAMKGSFWRKSIFALLAKVFDVPVALHLHGGIMKEFVARQPFLLRKLIQWILSKQSVVIVLSKSWKEYVKSISPNANIHILSNYVVLPELNGIEIRNDSRHIDVLFLGVINQAKGVFDLLPAFKDALSLQPTLRLVIGGKGEIERAQAIAKELKIESNVIFTGWVSGEEKLKLLRQAQLYVLPSYNEGLPVSVLEAMSWQIPIISTRVGGIPELVRDGIDGLLITAGDQSALAKAISRIGQDAELRRQMGANARQHVECNFSREVILPQLEALYQSLMQNNVSGSDGSPPTKH
jgi:glycosyltransferase involved in cell wall biosynthesis